VWKKKGNSRSHGLRSGDRSTRSIPKGGERRGRFRAKALPLYFYSAEQKESTLSSVERITKKKTCSSWWRGNVRGKRLLPPQEVLRRREGEGEFALLLGSGEESGLLLSPHSWGPAPKILLCEIGVWSAPSSIQVNRGGERPASSPVYEPSEKEETSVNPISRREGVSFTEQENPAVNHYDRSSSRETHKRGERRKTAKPSVST